MATTQPPFYVDPIAARLATAGGEHQRLLSSADSAGVWGINANLLSPPPPELCAQYESFAVALSAAMRPCGGYVYPAYTLHVTAASCSPFTHSRVRPHDRPALRKAWNRALSDFPPLAPFELTLMRPKLEHAAALFELTDPTGGVAALRGLFRDAFERHPALRELGSVVDDDSAFRIPGIVHSTILRVVAPPVGGITPEEVRRRFDIIAATWKPLKLRVSSVILVEEVVPYMHLHLSSGGADEGQICGRLTLSGHAAATRADGGYREPSAAEEAASSTLYPSGVAR